jgi:hypothetical protein
MEKGDRRAGTDHVVVATASSPWLRSAFSTGVTSCSSMATSDRQRGVLVHPPLEKSDQRRAPPALRSVEGPSILAATATAQASGAAPP